MERPVCVGIDLATANSAAAIFDGEQVQVVRSGGGGSIAPNVVRIDARGNTTVGAKARRCLDTDPNNTCRRVTDDARYIPLATARTLSSTISKSRSRSSSGMLSGGTTYTTSPSGRRYAPRRFASS
jgi:hypothetical protein